MTECLATNRARISQSILSGCLSIVDATYIVIFLLFSFSFRNCIYSLLSRNKGLIAGIRPPSGARCPRRLNVYAAIHAASPPKRHWLIPSPSQGVIIAPLPACRSQLYLITDPPIDKGFYSNSNSREPAQACGPTAGHIYQAIFPDVADIIEKATTWPSRTAERRICMQFSWKAWPPHSTGRPPRTLIPCPPNMGKSSIPCRPVYSMNGKLRVSRGTFHPHNCLARGWCRTLSTHRRSNISKYNALKRTAQSPPHSRQ